MPGQALPLEDASGRRGDRTWVLPTIVATFAAVVICALVVIAVKSDSDRLVKNVATSIRQSQANGCDRTQVKNGAERVTVAFRRETELSKFFDAYVPILNCRETYSPAAAGKAVPLDDRSEACFLRLVRDRVLVDADPTTDPKELEKLCRRYSPLGSGAPK